MRRWQIEYWSIGEKKGPVEKWLDKLDKDRLTSILKEIYLLEESGNGLRLPHSRPLSRGLFELRERRYGCRIYYMFKEEYIIILLAAGNKKSQKHDIKIARERLLQML